MKECEYKQGRMNQQSAANQVTAEHLTVVQITLEHLRMQSACGLENHPVESETSATVGCKAKGVLLYWAQSESLAR